MGLSIHSTAAYPKPRKDNSAALPRFFVSNPIVLKAWRVPWIAGNRREVFLRRQLLIRRTASCQPAILLSLSSFAMAGVKLLRFRVSNTFLSYSPIDSPAA